MARLRLLITAAFTAVSGALILSSSSFVYAQCADGYTLAPCIMTGGPADGSLCCSSFCATTENNCIDYCLANYSGDDYFKQILMGYCSSTCAVTGQQCNEWGLTYAAFNSKTPSINDLTAISHGTVAAAGSAITGYWGNDNSQHVNFIDGNGHIHELYIHPGSNWVDNDLTGFSGGMPAANGSALDGYWGSDNSQHVNFIDGNGHVHELYIKPGVTWWVDNDLTSFSGGTPASLGSALTAYWGGDSSQHVHFIDANSNVHELYIQSSVWNDNNLTNFASAALAGPQGALDSYEGSDGSRHVNFVDRNSHIHELRIDVNSDTWADNDLTALANGTPALGSTLSAHWGSDSSQHVIFIDGNAQVHELTIAPGSNWTDHNLFDSAGGGISAKSGTALSSRWVSGNSQHIDYIDVNNDVRELTIYPGGNWVNFNLNATNTGMALASGTSVHGYAGSDGSLHTNYADSDGHIHEFYYP